ncbi:MAG: hypothetical protein M9888_09950 [Chitinophagales bacterium]|nr:hypothetical protein [Chitinophagales bacterium]
MKTHFYLFFIVALFICAPNVSLAQSETCGQTPKDRIMLIGDSWANFMWTYRSMAEALRKNGFADIKEDGNFTAIISMQAETWASDGWKDLLDGRIRTSTEDVFVIFIGGNDVMWKWRPGKTIEDLKPYTDEMLYYTDQIIDIIFKHRPNAQVVIGSYDYPNFAETMIGNEWNPYYSQWEKFGFVAPEVLNPLLIDFETYRENYPRYKNNPNIHYINNMGVAQYYGGYPTASLFPPYATFPPKAVKLPYGDTRYPTHPSYMGLAGYDAYHFNGKGYQFIAHNMIRNYIGDYFRQQIYNYSFHSTGKQDGWVSSNGIVNQGNGGKIGKVNSEQFAGIFSFNTDFPEGVTIDKGALYLARKSGLGQLRNNENVVDRLTVEMKVGNFGTSADIDPADFSDNADFVTTGCIVGVPNGDEYKFRVDLNQDVLDAIASSKRVQFRVKVDFGPNSANMTYFEYFGGNTEDKYWAPTLDLRMSDVPTPVGVKDQSVMPLSIYPNPVNDVLNFDIPLEFRKSGVSATIINSIGEIVKSWDNVGVKNQVREQVSVTDLPAGVYHISMTDGYQIRNGSIVIQR